MNPMDSCFVIGYTNRLGKRHTEKMWTLKLGGSIVTRCPVARPLLIPTVATNPWDRGIVVGRQGSCRQIKGKSSRPSHSIASDAASHGILTKGGISDSQKSPNIRMPGSSASNLRM
jgi:hypothetical protein